MSAIKATSPLRLELADVQAPLVFCDADGKVLDWTLPASRLLTHLGVRSDLPALLPRALWSELERTVPGEALQWRPPQDGRHLLGCTRYRARGGYLLVLKDISSQHAALSKLLQRQRLEVTGRLVASIAHELRNAVASISYNAQLVELTCQTGSPQEVIEVAAAIQTATGHLEATLRGLLDYAKSTPATLDAVDLQGVVNRACGFLRSIFREGAHRVVFHAAADARWVRGNAIAIEQILINLLLNSAEAADAASMRVTAQIHCTLERAPRANSETESMVRVQIVDDGPGVPAHLRDLIFEPFFTTSDEGTGLGLTTARESLEQLGGHLVLEPSQVGACFSAYFSPGSPYA